MASEVFADGMLEGSTALVTGGGTNLGKAAASELRRCGARVLIAGRREEVLRATAEEIGCEWAAGDIREPEQAARIVARVEGPLDVLVNNAGGQYFVPAEQIASKGWAAVQRLNVGGTLTMIDAALQSALGPSGMTIVNVTVSPHRGFPAMAHTGAARAAVEQMGAELARERAGEGVAVVGLAIGRFDTDSLRKYPAVLQDTMREAIPLQRLGTLEEFGWTVAMLASPLGRALSGSVLTLDGGFDNWYGPWPPPEMTGEDGVVPVEDRGGARAR